MAPNTDPQPQAEASAAASASAGDPGTSQERRQRRHARTRRDILAAAREVMLESGAGGITVREVAHRADFSPAALYKYFAGRDEIVGALTHESFLILKHFIDRVPESLPPDKRLIALGMAYMRFAKENPADLACILESTSRPLPDSLDLSVGLAAVKALRSTLEDGVRQGVFRRLTAKELAAVSYGMWSLVHGMTTLRGIDLGPVSLEISPDPRRVLQTYVDGLRRGDA